MEEESGRVNNNEVVLRLRLSRGLVVAVALVAARALGIVAATGSSRSPTRR